MTAHPDLKHFVRLDKTPNGLPQVQVSHSGGPFVRDSVVLRPGSISVGCTEASVEVLEYLLEKHRENYPIKPLPTKVTLQ